MKTIFEKTEDVLLEKGFSFEQKNFKKPWGGYFVIASDKQKLFLKTYYPELDESEFTNGKKISPKILIILPHKKLSWQYHYRRSEIWKVIEGKVGVIKSDNDIQTEMTIHQTHDVVTLKQGERHRIIGLQATAIIAEIWQHTDNDNLSDEDDIVRLDDDYGR